MSNKQMPIERSIPLANKVANHLREQLRSKTSNDERLSGELEIASELGVSRGTVRQALAILEREGAIRRRQGDGTYVNSQVLNIKTRAETAYEFTELIKSLGYKAEIVLINAGHESASKDLAERLNVKPRAKLLVIRKLFFADDKPAIYCTDMIPEELVCKPFEESELKKPVYDLLYQQCNLRVAHILAEFTPVVARGELTELLKCQEGEPLALFEELNYSEDNKPVMFARIYYREPLTRFTILRKKT
ncbi:MAG: GntR family transcriptional regulator [Chloroflexi bacterium]|nr:GntR family transcriptional regulator [Chloroflexota bacterium]